MNPAIRKIIHIDMDAFYASVEQRDDPALRGRPVAVGSAARRGVVAAASYEARAFGVHSAMPAGAALQRCPDLVFVPPRFDVYRAISGQIHAIFADYTPLIEPLSLDEAYLDVTENRRGHATASGAAREIRGRILEETGLTASAGVSYNKLLAKLASGHRKPNGQFVVPPEAGPAFVEALRVEKFPGVGPVTAARLNRLGIFTGADLRRQSLAFLQRRFGKSGAWFHGVARGEDERPVAPDRPRKSSGSETTFAADLTEPGEIEAAVAALAEDVFAWCDKTGSFGRTVTVKILGGLPPDDPQPNPPLPGELARGPAGGQPRPRPVGVPADAGSAARRGERFAFRAAAPGGRGSARPGAGSVTPLRQGVGCIHLRGAPAATVGFDPRSPIPFRHRRP